jgi:phosphoribosylamine--glycine ligase
MTRVCVVGSGGREHALAHVLSRDADVVVTPGNPGIPGSISTPAEEIVADLFVVGPEAPLVDGLADRLRAQGKLVFGPGADGARLEGSKAWMKQLLVDAGVPTAAYGAFTEAKPALAFLDTMTIPYVIKTDGLAAGKGVLVTDSLADARAAVRNYLSGEAFGEAGRTVVIEEGLQGPEISVFAVCDGARAVVLSAAQDFKRVRDDDQGPNTGGMGAYTPVPSAPPGLIEDIRERFIVPTLTALRRRGIDYRGVLFAGLMLTPDGPKMLEYNVRFGDPEAEIVLPRMESSLVDLLSQAAAGQLVDAPVINTDALVAVVCASEGYPEAPRTGDVIEGLDQAAKLAGVEGVFCAGVAAAADGSLVTAGGRVVAVTGRGSTIAAARDAAYAAAELVTWPGRHMRTDIARVAVAQERTAAKETAMEGTS